MRASGGLDCGLVGVLFDQKRCHRQRNMIVVCNLRRGATDRGRESIIIASRCVHCVMLPGACYPTFAISHLLARLYLQFFEGDLSKNSSKNVESFSSMNSRSVDLKLGDERRFESDVTRRDGLRARKSCPSIFGITFERSGDRPCANVFSRRQLSKGNVGFYCWIEKSVVPVVLGLGQAVVVVSRQTVYKDWIASLVAAINRLIEPLVSFQERCLLWVVIGPLISASWNFCPLINLNELVSSNFVQ